MSEMKTMSYSEMVQFFIDEYILASDKERVEYAGAYPCNWKRVHGYVFVATIDDNGKPLLEVYANRDIVNWTRRMITFLKEEVDDEDATDIIDAYVLTKKFPYV